MNIIFIEPFGKLAGQPAVYLSRLTEHMLEGNKVTIITYDGIVEDLLSKDIEHILLSDRFLAVKIMTKILPLSNSLSKTKIYIALYELISSLLAIIYAARIIRDKKESVIYYLDGEPLIALLFGFLVKQKFFILIPRVLPYLKNHISHDAGNAKVFICSLISIILKKIYIQTLLQNRYICHTRQTYEHLKDSIIFDNLCYIPWGVTEHSLNLHQTTVRDELRLKNSELFLVFGTNHYGKRYRHLFESLKHLNDEDIIILFVGKIVTKMNDPFLLSREFQVEKNVIIIDDYVPEADFPKYFQGVDAIILPYSKKFLFASGILTHALEYRLPIIASDVGQMGTWVREGGLGLTYHPEDSQDLSQKIRKFLALEEKEKESYKNNIRKFSEHISWKKVAHAHLAYFRGERIEFEY